MFEKEAEERFIKSYPEFCYNGKPLSPYWDLWQDGAEFGYNKGKEDAKEELEQIRNERKFFQEKCDDVYLRKIANLEKENAELKEIAEFQQSSNMSRHFENKKLKEGLIVGSTWNKALNSMNKALEEERDKYRNMVFDKMEQLTKAKEIIFTLLDNFAYPIEREDWTAEGVEILDKAEQFLKEADE